MARTLLPPKGTRVTISKDFEPHNKLCPETSHPWVYQGLEVSSGEVYVALKSCGVKILIEPERVIVP